MFEEKKLRHNRYVNNKQVKKKNVQSWTRKVIVPCSHFILGLKIWSYTIIQIREKMSRQIKALIPIAMVTNLISLTLFFSVTFTS